MIVRSLRRRRGILMDICNDTSEGGRRVGRRLREFGLEVRKILVNFVVWAVEVLTGDVL